MIAAPPGRRRAPGAAARRAPRRRSRAGRTPARTLRRTATATPERDRHADVDATATATPTASPTPRQRATATPARPRRRPPRPAGPRHRDRQRPVGHRHRLRGDVQRSLSTAPARRSQCRLDGAPGSRAPPPSRSPRSPTARTSSAVRAGTDPTPAVRRWTVDTAAPETKIVGGAEGELDGGPFTFAFAAPTPPRTFQCRVDEGDVAGVHVAAAARGGRARRAHVRGPRARRPRPRRRARPPPRTLDGRRRRRRHLHLRAHEPASAATTSASPRPGPAAAWEWALFGDGEFVDGTEPTARAPVPEAGLDHDRAADHRRDRRKGRLAPPGLRPRLVTCPRAARTPRPPIQQNPAHDGFNPADRPAPPLERAWARDLGGEVSNPLVVGDRIFVTVTLADGRRRARRAQPPHRRRCSGGAASAKASWGAAYDDGRIFTIEREGFAARRRCRKRPDAVDRSSAGLCIATALVADDGLVYAVANGHRDQRPRLRCPRRRAGLAAGMPTEINGAPMPALDGDDLFLGYGCKGAFGMAKDTGYAQWWHDGNCQIEGRHVRTVGPPRRPPVQRRAAGLRPRAGHRQRHHHRQARRDVPGRRRAAGVRRRHAAAGPQRRARGLRRALGLDGVDVRRATASSPAPR